MIYATMEELVTRLRAPLFYIEYPDEQCIFAFAYLPAVGRILVETSNMTTHGPNVNAKSELLKLIQVGKVIFTVWVDSANDVDAFLQTETFKAFFGEEFRFHAS